jgi:hypothetical protein
MPLHVELAGRTINARRFREGAIVRASQTLYEIGRGRGLDPP